jgi:hypothetical protein
VQGFALGRPQPAGAITDLLVAELAADRRSFTSATVITRLIRQPARDSDEPTS